jgi:molecular chaperone GrpE
MFRFLFFRKLRWTMSTKTTGQWESGVEDSVGTESDIREGAASGEGQGTPSKSPTTQRTSGDSTAEDLEQLKAKAAKADEHWDRLVRQTADFENYKKRAARERQEATKFANEALLEKLVPILDTFDMALAAASNSESASIEALRTGVSMIHSQLKNVLTQAGLEEIDATGQAFDPNWHEAISQQESAEVPEGRVLQQARKGYKLRERLLRPATVIVAKKPAT